MDGVKLLPPLRSPEKLTIASLKPQKRALTSASQSEQDMSSKFCKDFLYDGSGFENQCISSYITYCDVSLYFRFGVCKLYLSIIAKATSFGYSIY